MEEEGDFNSSHVMLQGCCPQKTKVVDEAARSIRQTSRRIRRRPSETRTTTSTTCQSALCHASLLLIPLALVFLWSSSSSGKIDTSIFSNHNLSNNNHHHHHHQDRRFLVLQRNKRAGPAVASTHSYSDYVGYHKRTGQPQDSYYAFPTDDYDLQLAAAQTEQAMLQQQQEQAGSSGSSTKQQQQSVAQTASAARQRLRYRLTREQTDLTDVFFCIGLALAWTVWMLRSFLKSELLRYTQDSIMVRGHVLQVTLEEETSLGTGIPTYKAVIDYMVNGKDGGNAEAGGANKIQIRKQFETQTHLEQGFANVELLVLHDEPTHSVLKEDWEQQVEELEDGNRGVIFCLPSIVWKRGWIAFCVLIVLASLGAGVLAVHRLPHEQRATGWICVCAAITLLLPTAIAIRMFMTCIQRSLQQGTQAAGVIVQGGGAGAAQGACSCDALDNVLDVTSVCDNEKNAAGVAAAGIVAANYSTDAAQRQAIVRTPDVDETGCYVIKMPPNQLGQRFRSDVSDISAVSQTLQQINNFSHGNSGLATNGGAGANGAVILNGEGDSGGGAVVVSNPAAVDTTPRPRLF